MVDLTTFNSTTTKQNHTFCLFYGIYLHILWDIFTYFMGYIYIFYGIYLHILWDIFTYFMGYIYIFYGIYLHILWYIYTYFMGYIYVFYGIYLRVCFHSRQFDKLSSQFPQCTYPIYPQCTNSEQKLKHFCSEWCTLVCHIRSKWVNIRKILLVMIQLLFLFLSCHVYKEGFWTF